MAADCKYIYGPVPSRRLGRSLGIDLVPFKTCTYDCIYCQLGRTTHKTMNRRAYFPVNEIMAELKQVLNAGETPDYIAAIVDMLMQSGDLLRTGMDGKYHILIEDES